VSQPAKANFSPHVMLSKPRKGSRMITQKTGNAVPQQFQSRQDQQSVAGAIDLPLVHEADQEYAIRIVPIVSSIQLPS
jgi:hypothetical protein